MPTSLDQAKPLYGRFCSLPACHLSRRSRGRSSTLFLQLFHLDREARALCAHTLDLSNKVLILKLLTNPCFLGFNMHWSRICMQLEDLFVKPEYRSKGLGKALFAELAKVAQEKVRQLSFILLTAKHLSADRTVLAWTGPC